MEVCFTFVDTAFLLCGANLIKKVASVDLLLKSGQNLSINIQFLNDSLIFSCGHKRNLTMTKAGKTVSRCTMAAPTPVCGMIYHVIKPLTTSVNYTEVGVGTDLLFHIF